MGTLNGLEVMLSLAVLEEIIPKFGVIRAKYPDVEASFSMMPIKERSLLPIRNINKKKKAVSVVEEEKLKLSKHLMQVEMLLKIVKDELNSRMTFKSLLIYNETFRKMMEEENQIEKDYKNSIACESTSAKTMKDLNDELLKAENEQNSLKSTEEFIDFKLKCIDSYLPNYYKAKVDQNILRIEMKKKSWEDKLEELLKAEEDEQKVHELIVKYLSYNIMKLDKSLQYWNKSYEEDIELRRQLLHKQEMEINNQRFATSQLSAQFERREAELLNYLEVRAERIRQEDLEIKRTRAAVKIQSWWRGCMVRWELGKYCQDLGKRRKKKTKKK